ncbi:MAG: type II secretion system F family protein [Vulcanimicrobiota bacterium]
MDKVRCPAHIVILFTRQLATMVRTGVPILVALDTLSHQPEHPNFGEVISTVAARVASGHHFSASLALFPRIFPKVYLAMVSIGENTGHLDVALEQLADWQESDDKLYRRVKGALTYPAFVMMLTCALTLILFYTVLPNFINIFQEMDIELPMTTKVMILITNLVKNPGAWVVGLALAAAILVGIRDLYRTEAGGVAIFRFLSSIPLLGTMLRLATTSRFAAAASALINAGVDLPRSLRMSAHASGSPVLRADARWLSESLQEGTLASDHMATRPDIYPTTLTHMIKAGEESSHLADMFSRVAGYYDTEVGFKIETLGAALEPLLLGFVAFVVGFIVLSVLVPLYSYLGTLA